VGDQADRSIFDDVDGAPFTERRDCQLRHATEDGFDVER